MEPVQCLFGVVVLLVGLACEVTALPHWTLPPMKPPLPSQQLSNFPPPAVSFDKCQVEEDEKIQCGTQDITAEQCENINCCFVGRHCYYGKAGICGLMCSL